MEDADVRGSSSNEGRHPHAHHHERPMGPEEAMRSLLLLGQVALDAGDYESAVEAYASALQLGQNEVALYNLASLYARGLGVRQDFARAARLFRQAELLGNGRAGTLCRKCMYDYIDDDLAGKTPLDLYAKMSVFVTLVYPEAADQKQEVNRGLLVIANTYLSAGNRAKAEKALRAAAEYGNDDSAQCRLASLDDVPNSSIE